jgi:hypothetical protein
MKTTDFSSPISSIRLAENLEKQFGSRVNLNKYNREQLEDMRNRLRTRVFQQEGSAKFNDLLQKESYQKDKAMLELLNTRIKEMLGENIKKLRDKMDELSEAKKGDGNLANNAKPYDKVTRGDVIAGRLGKDEKGGKKVKEGFPTVADAKARAEKEKTTGKFDKKTNPQTGGTIYTKKHTKSDAAPEKNVKEVKMSDLPSTKVQGKSYGNQKDYQRPPEDARKPAKTMPLKKTGKPLGEAGMSAMEGKKAKPDFLDVNKNGNKTEPMKTAAADKKAGPKKGVNPFAKKGSSVKESQYKHNVRFVNESLAFLLREDEEGKAKTITAAGDMVNDFTSWMQRVGQYQTKAIIELSDQIRAEFGQAEAEQFKQTVGPALSATLEVLTTNREAISGAVATLAGESTPEDTMGMDPMADAPMEPGMDAAMPDAMNPELPGSDEFGASDAAAGGAETAGRAMRESKEVRRARRLSEAHSIMSKLAK